MTIIETSTTLSFGLDTTVKPGDMADVLSAVATITKKGKYATPVQTAVSIEWDDDTNVRVTATDSYRIMSAGTDTEYNPMPYQILVSGADAKNIGKLLKGRTCHSATFTVADGWFTVSTADGSVRAELLTFSYPKYRELFNSVTLDAWPENGDRPGFDSALLAGLLSAFDMLTPGDGGRIVVAGMTDKKPMIVRTDVPFGCWHVAGLLMPRRK